ncbi:MAG: PolC-type DNA polymerase III [Candidatus Nanoarchaeia archaeon]
MVDYVVLDIETTGLSRYRHKITEIAAVKYGKGKEVGSFQKLVNPECHIPSFITKLTGIDDDMVKDADTIDEVLPEFLDFLGDSTIVAHNASFDFGFLNVNAQTHLDTHLCNNRLCTRKLANRLLPDLPRKRLGDVCEHFDIQNEQAHRAMGDTRATALVFSSFLEMLREFDISTHDDIIRFEKSPKGKFRRAI